MTIKQIAVPYPRPPVFSEFKREEMMAWAVKQANERKIPRLMQSPIGDGTITIVGYGPSLADTWQHIKPPLITTSGALKFLMSKGLKPKLGQWFHADMDPRPHKLDFITDPSPDVIYLMASVCHPRTWKTLAGMKVVMWHSMSGPHTPQWIHDNDPGTLLIAAGSTIGLSAIHLGGCLGFRHFEIHGFDGCFLNGKRHAGDHAGHQHGEVIREETWGTFTTSKIMDNANYETRYLLDHFPIFCVFHGNGLMQNWVKHDQFPNACTADDPRADGIRAGKFVILNDEEAKQLKVA